MDIRDTLSRLLHQSRRAHTAGKGPLLQLPHTGYLRYDDPRMLGTVARIEQTLLRDGLVRRG